MEKFLGLESDSLLLVVGVSVPVFVANAVFRSHKVTTIIQMSEAASETFCINASLNQKQATCCLWGQVDAVLCSHKVQVASITEIPGLLPIPLSALHC